MLKFNFISRNDYEMPDLKRSQGILQDDSRVWHFLFNSSSPNYETLQLLTDQPPDHWCEFGPPQQTPTPNTLRRHEYGKVVESRLAGKLGATDDAIFPGIPTTKYAGYRLQIRRDPTRRDDPIRGRISSDYTKTRTRARLFSLGVS